MNLSITEAFLLLREECDLKFYIKYYSLDDDYIYLLFIPSDFIPLFDTLNGTYKHSPVN